jgi:prepilin-type N-terminal cleavage/methylation domain-containing protein
MNRAFTLVEIVVALVVGVIVAGATTISLSQLSKAKARSLARQEAFARAHAGASRIAADVRAAARENDLTFAKVAILPGGDPALRNDSVLLWCRSFAPVRGLPDYSEGGDAEVQYRVLPMLDDSGRTSLWRRADAPPDRALDAGGVAELVVAGIVSLAAEASDGVSWFDAWDSDSYGYPHALRVTLVAVADDGRTSAVAREVISLDRTPLPPPAAADTSGSATQTASAAGGVP